MQRQEQSDGEGADAGRNPPRADGPVRFDHDTNGMIVLGGGDADADAAVASCRRRCRRASVDVVIGSGRHRSLSLSLSVEE